VDKNAPLANDEYFYNGGSGKLDSREVKDGVPLSQDDF